MPAKFWNNEKLKQRLIDIPPSLIREDGIEVCPWVDVRVVENTDKVTYLVLPPKPAEDLTELTSNQLTAVAGGFFFPGFPLLFGKLCSVKVWRNPNQEVHTDQQTHKPGRKDKLRFSFARCSVVTTPTAL